MIKLTGLWKKKNDKGQTYLAGSVNGISGVIILPNNYKNTDTDPDFFLFFTQNKKNEDVGKKNNQGF